MLHMLLNGFLLACGASVAIVLLPILATLVFIVLAIAVSVAIDLVAFPFRVAERMHVRRRRLRAVRR